jgi:putative ABC transport system permease protein
MDLEPSDHYKALHMLKNFFKITFRNLWRRKGFSAINIAGLAIGMAAAILILLWVQNERSTDRFYTNTDRLYLIFSRDKLGGEMHSWPSSPEVMAPVLKKDYPEVEDAVRFTNINFLVSSGEKRFTLRGAFADSSFLKLFDFPLLDGNAAQVLANPHNIVLTKQLAIRLFGSEEAMGKTVRIDSTDNFTVAGVLKDLPANTGFDFEYLLPWMYRSKIGFAESTWGSSSYSTFVLLKPNASQAAFDQKVKKIVSSHSDETVEVFTQPLNRLYLYSKDDNGRLVAGRIEIVRLFSLIAVFILLIACINFMNLSTARSEIRAKEVGIRKVVGAFRNSLLLQFLGESILFASLAFGLALLLVQISLKGFNELVGKELFVDYHNPHLWMFATGFILLTGIVAGSYPAFYLSSFRPALVLKGSFRKVNALVTPRKVLVVLQFTFAIVLITSTIIIERQIQYAKDRESGYKRNNLIFTFTNGDVTNHYDLIKHDLLTGGAAVGVTRSLNPITQRWSAGWGFRWEGSTETDTKIQFVRLGSDADFVKTIGVTLLKGRDIDTKTYSSDTAAMLLNESAVRAMHMDNPIGKIVRRDGDHNWTVVGVIKDFILESPYETRINPMMIIGPTSFFQVIHIKLNPVNITSDNLAKVEKIFKQYNPLYPFEYRFADETYALKFQEEQRYGTLAALFGGLTIFISCLGLFGLASYMAENRIKEIGIRKVLGASVGSIATLLSKEFIKLILVAILLASPIAWFTMNAWLDGYSYRIHIGAWIFLAAGGLSIVIALVTVSYQAIKAAMANPIRSLRTQ